MGTHHTKVQIYYYYYYCSQNTENDSKVSPVKQHVFTETLKEWIHTINSSNMKE